MIDRSFLYVCLHPASKTACVKVLEAETARHAREIVDRWNRQGGGRWVYYLGSIIPYDYTLVEDVPKFEVHEKEGRSQ